MTRPQASPDRTHVPCARCAIAVSVREARVTSEPWVRLHPHCEEAYHNEGT